MNKTAKTAKTAFMMFLLTFCGIATVQASEVLTPETTSSAGAIAPWLCIGASVLALIFAVVFYKKMMSASEGTEQMITIAKHVKDGAYAYLFRQYKVVGLVFAILFVIFAILAYMGVQNPFVPIAFLTGGFFSGLCGFLGMKTATNASARTAQGASEGLNRGLQVAFRSGAVMGLVVVGLGLIDIARKIFRRQKSFDTNTAGLRMNKASIFLESS